MAGPPALSEPILHVDMDAFFVEVERRLDPRLRGRPVIVGGLGRRGVVASASYEARAHGVTSAMPMAEARRRCPQAAFVAPRHGRYGEASEEVFAVIAGFTPVVERLSVDEAFLDVSGLRRRYGSGRAVAEAIQSAIEAETGLPASVGVAATKFVAKLASNAAKPHGIHVVPAGQETTFLHPLPVRALWGVGEATRAALEVLGVETIGDLAATPVSALAARVGRSMAQHLHTLASGVDHRPVEPGGGAKSISVEETYEWDISGDEAVHTQLVALCDRLARRLHRAGMAGRTVTLKARRPDFTTITRSMTPDEPVAGYADLTAAVETLRGRTGSPDGPFRLLGVGVSGLVEERHPRQLSLDPGDADRRRRREVDDVAEAVRDRFGDHAVIPARLVKRRPAGEDGTRNGSPRP